MGWQFDGTNDYVTVADNAGLTLPDGDWTIAFWAKPNLTGSNINAFFAWGVADASPSVDLIYAEASHALSNGAQFRAVDSDGDKAVSQAASVFTDGTWQHVSCERSGSTFTLYVDNVSKLSDTDALVDGINVADSLYLGFANGASTYFQGTMAEFAIWTDVNSSRRTALSGGSSYDDYTTNRTQYISMRDGYTEEDQSATVTNNGSVEDATDHPAIETYVAPPILSSAATMYTPSITTGGVSVSTPLIAAGTTLYSPSINPGAAVLSLPFISSTLSLFPPGISADDVLLLPYLDSTTTLYSPSLLYGQTLTLPQIASGTALYTPTVSPGSVSLGTPLLSSSLQMFSPTLLFNQTITMPLLSSSLQMFSPTINEAWPTIETATSLSWSNTETSSSAIWTDTDL